MKDNRAANPLRDGGNSENISQSTKYGAYVLIALLVLFIIWVNVAQPSLPGVEVDKIASITSWYGGATSTDRESFLKRDKLPDLEVEILAIGVKNGEKFIPNDTLTNSSLGAIRVQVKNKGNAPSGEWMLSMDYPTIIPFNFTSETLTPLEKDEKRTFTLTFDKLKTGIEQRIIVSVNHEGKEDDKENNTTSNRIDVF